MPGVVRKFFVVSTFLWIALLTFLPVLLNLFVLPSFEGFHNHVHERLIISESSPRNRRKLDKLVVRKSYDSHSPQHLDKRLHDGHRETVRRRHARNHGNQNVLDAIGAPPGKNDGSPHISFVDLDVSSPQEKNASTTTTTKPDYRLIYFLHIHKSGGSCMCQAARRNHMRTNKHNCNVQADQRCCGGNDSVEAQQAFAHRNALQYSFVANERDMYRAMDAQNYRYVVMLRDSQSRYKSHWQHVYRRYPDTTGTFASWYRHQPDNWNTRKICGTDCQKIPKYGISRQVFDQTVKRLGRFDHVLFLEDFNRSYVEFARSVQWKHMPVYTKPIRNIAYPMDNEKSAAAAWDPFMSALDDALYELAKQGFKGQSNPQLPHSLEQRLEDYFLRGPAGACHNPCCGQECSQY